MDYRFLSSEQIDRNRWDTILESEPLAPIYSYSWYLDTIAENWGAIISGDYRSILPLAFRRKFGIRYLYQPFFSRNFGVYGLKNNEIGAVKYLIELSGKFRYWDFCIEISNTISIADLRINNRIYQLLDLNKPYEELCKAYTGNLKRSIRDANAENLRIVEANDLHHFTLQFKKFTAARIKEFNTKDYDKLEILLGKCNQFAKTWHYSVMKNGIELSSAFFVRKGHRITYIEGYNSPEGRKLQSMHLLFDHFVREHAGQNLLVDFGGSNVPSIAHFFHCYGATDHNYYNIRLNKLPLLLKTFKK